MHVKRQENTIHNEENNKSIEIDPELTQKLELADKDIETFITTIFYMFEKLQTQKTFFKRPRYNFQR